MNKYFITLVLVTLTGCTHVLKDSIKTLEDVEIVEEDFELLEEDVA